MNDTAKPKYHILQSVGWMVRMAWAHGRRVLFFCVGVATVNVLLNLAQLYVAPEILARVEEHASIWRLLATIGAFTAALLLLNGLKEYLSLNALFARVDVRSAIIDEVTQKALLTSYPNTLKTDFLQMREKAELVCGDNSAATEHIWETLTQLLAGVGGLLISLTILSGLNTWLIVVIVATCFIGFLVSRATNQWRYAHRDEEERYYHQKSYLRQKAESVELAKDIRLFGLQNWLSTLVEQIHDVYLDFSLRRERVEMLADFTEAGLTLARNGIAYAYLLRLALQDNLPVSTFLLYFTAISTFTTWIMSILQQLSRLHRESLDISRVREFLDYPEPFLFDEGEPIPPAAHYELRLDHVSYRYPGAAQDSLHDVDLTIAPGEKLAIVGLNGAGKTTLVKLLCGLLDPTRGVVRLNGEDIRVFDRRAYYDLFSAVFQDVSLLDVTVAEQITQTTAAFDGDKMDDVLQKANLKSVVDKLPRGLDTHMGREVYMDGVLFSGGETQRLLLARALYKDTPILVLDEPTAALDPLAENDIYQKYQSMTEKKTSLFISHRLASTRFCDRILFLADGGIREEGTHDELVARGGEYAHLYEVQRVYYQQGKEF